MSRVLLPMLHAIACVVSVHAMQESNDEQWPGSLRCLEVRKIDTELQLQHTFVFS